MSHMCAPKYRIKPPRYGQRWDQWEIQLIVACLRKHKTIKHIATVLGRTTGSTVHELFRHVNCNAHLLNNKQVRKAYEKGERFVRNTEFKYEITIPKRCRK